MKHPAEHDIDLLCQDFFLTRLHQQGGVISRSEARGLSDEDFDYQECKAGVGLMDYVSQMSEGPSQ